jgi:hypothetical protein
MCQWEHTGRYKQELQRFVDWSMLFSEWILSKFGFLYTLQLVEGGYDIKDGHKRLWLEKLQCSLQLDTAGDDTLDMASIYEHGCKHCHICLIKGFRHKTWRIGKFLENGGPILRKFYKIQFGNLVKYYSLLFVVISSYWCIYVEKECQSY